MRSAFVLALAVSFVSVARPAPAATAAFDPTEVWRPIYSYLGAWKGTRSGPSGPVKVARVYATAATNDHLEITEKDKGRPRAAVRWTIRIDPERRVLVLQEVAADGAPAELTLAPPASPAGPLVFESAASEAARTRVTYERTGEHAFVERIERADAGGAFRLVEESRFERAD